MPNNLGASFGASEPRISAKPGRMQGNLTRERSGMTRSVDAASSSMLLGQAEGARQFPEPEKRHAVRGLVHDRYRWVSRHGRFPEPNMIPVSETEVFEAAYGDGSGRDYWNAWLYEQQESALAKTLAVHIGDNDALMHFLWTKALMALQAAAGETPRAKIESMLRNPNTRALVPDSLQRFLEPQAAPILEATADGAKQGSKRSGREDKNKGGRPPRWDWASFDKEIIRLANTPDGLPERPILTKHMLDWCGTEWGDTPADSTVRERIARLHPEA